MKVPKDLRKAFGKEIIRQSLGTSDPREAARLVRFESSKLDAAFDLEREKIKNSQSAHAERKELSEIEVHQMVCRFLIGLEQKSETWWESEGRFLDEDDIRETIHNLNVDAVVYSGGSPHYRSEDGEPKAEVDNFLEKEGVSIPKGSRGYKKLLSLFRLALLENVQRSADRLERKAVTSHTERFREIFSHTELPVKKRMTLGELLASHKRALSAAKRTQGTINTYEIPSRLLLEVLGKDTLVDKISRSDIERLFSLLSRIPSNATKKYKGLTIERAIAKADRDGSVGRLSAKTLENYFNNISSIFKFAKERELIASNPANDRLLRASLINGDDEENVKAVFMIEELKTLFHAPLYVGCVGDQMGYLKSGPSFIRRGRFWVPLISLFHGLRCNEAVQLYTEDVCEDEGIPYFFIRQTRADGSKCDKRLKTSQSKRRVPIHKELLEIGFLDFVRQRRGDSAHPRLFPELPCGATGYFSNPFSKWFGRFKLNVLGAECEATFHSFRHLFRTALGEVGTPEGDVEALGGWESKGRSSEKHYDKPSLKRLRNRIDEVSYPGLDLSHLYKRLSVDEPPGFPRPRVRERRVRV